MRRTIDIMYCVISCFFVVFSAHGAPKNTPTDDSRVRTLCFGETWGANRDMLSQAIKTMFDANWRENAVKLDAFEVDQEIKRSEARFRRVQESYVDFDMNASAYRASPLATHFKAGQSQAVLNVNLSHADRYFFFQNSRLSKIVDVAPASKFKSLSDFRKWQSKTLGLKSIRLCEDATDTKSTLVDFCIEDQSKVYSSFLLVAVDPQADWINGGAVTEVVDDDGMLPDVFSDDPTLEDNTDLVDELTGRKKPVARPARNKSNSRTAATSKTSKKATPRKKPKKSLSDDEDVLY